MAKLVSTTITMPRELRARLEAEAGRQTRSLSQQIVHMLTDAMAKADAANKEAEAA